MMAHLPPELERKIFELAARNDGPMAAVLTRVCARAQTWIEPILYESVFLPETKIGFSEGKTTAQLFLRTLESRPREFFAKHVKTLHLEPTPDNNIVSLKLLTFCSSAHTLALHYWWTGSADIISALSAMDSLDLRNVSLPGESWDFRRPAFRNVTHLMLDACPPPNVELIPNLTHLALFRVLMVAEIRRWTVMSAPKLEVFVLQGNLGVHTWDVNIKLHRGEPISHVSLVYCLTTRYDEWARGPAHSFWDELEEFLVNSPVPASQT